MKMKKIFKKAHKMTREMVKEYGVDYQAQFGLCLSYLLEEKKEEEEVKVNFKGTEKQIKFAQDIFEKTIGRVLEELEESIEETKFRSKEGKERAISRLEETKRNLQELDAGDFIGEWKWYLDEEFIRVINDAQDWLNKETGVAITARVWTTLAEKYYLNI